MSPMQGRVRVITRPSKRVESKGSIIDKLKDYLPLITLLAFGFGYLDLYFYYKSFGINISQYIAITEIITLYLDKLIFYFLYCIGISILIIFALLDEESEDNNARV